MIQITLTEKNAICERYPDVKFVRTMKHDSKRHHYYMPEVGAPMRYLNTLRGVEVPRENDKRRKPNHKANRSR